VSFQWTFEDRQRWSATDRVRQTVPGARCCDGEGAVTHCCTLRRRHDEIGRWRRAQATPWFHTRDRADSSADSSVWTVERTGKPVRTACTGCAEYTQPMYIAVDSIHTAVGRFQLPVRRSGIRCRASWAIQRAVLTVLNSFSRQSFSVSTNVTSALEVF